MQELMGSCFYVDYETYRSGTDSLNTSPPTAAVTDLPTDNLGAYSASFSPLHFDGSLFDMYYQLAPSCSYGDLGIVSDDFINCSLSKPEVLDIGMSEQISLFWKLYSEYPSHLKRLKRRTRRKKKKYLTHE